MNGTNAELAAALKGMADMAAALKGMADMLSGDTASAGVHFACDEADVIANVLVHAGYPEVAASWLGSHAMDDEEPEEDGTGDQHAHLATGDHAHGYTIDMSAARQYVAEHFGN